MKPIVEDELSFALGKFVKQQNRQSALNLQDLKNLLAISTDKYKDRFTIKLGQSLRVVEVDNVECFYSKNKGTYLYTADRSNLLIDQSLDQLEKLLDPSLFFRINRSYIVNILYIKDIMIHSNSRLKIILQHYPCQDLIISREKVADFKFWLG